MARTSALHITHDDHAPSEHTLSLVRRCLVPCRLPRTWFAGRCSWYVVRGAWFVIRGSNNEQRVRQSWRDGVLLGVSASPVMRPPLSIRDARSDYGKDRSAESKDRSRPKQARRIRSERLQNELDPDKPEYPDDSKGGETV